MFLSCSRQSQTYHSHLELCEAGVCYSVCRCGKNKHRDPWNLVSLTLIGNKSEALISNQSYPKSKPI